MRVRDVARIELGSQDYSVAGRFNGKPSAIIATYQLPGSNAVDAAAGVNKLMAQDEGALSGGHGLRRRARYDALGHGGHEGNRCNAFDRPRAGDSCGLHLPAGLARHADSAARRAGFADRHVRVFPVFRFLHQHAFSLWSGAGDRPGGGRCHRRGRRRGAPHRGGHDAEGLRR